MFRQRVENIAIEDETAHFEQFHLLLQCFSKVFKCHQCEVNKVFKIGLLQMRQNVAGYWKWLNYLKVALN